MSHTSVPRQNRPLAGTAGLVLALLVGALSLALLPSPAEALGIGTIYTIAGTGFSVDGGDGAPAAFADLSGCAGLAIDANGNVFISDSFNHVVRMITAATGLITSYAGTGTEGAGPVGNQATITALNSPAGLAVDATGNLFICDKGNYRILKVSATTGLVGAVAGTGFYGFTGDGGAATSAKLASPNGIAVDSSGDIFFSDSGIQRVREVVAATGIINTVAGDGVAGFSGDNGVATAALAIISPCIQRLLPSGAGSAACAAA